MIYLKQSTAVDVLVGPFVDDADGKTAETALTIAQADVRLSKNGQNMASKNDDTSCAHDELGYYNCELDATDTNTLGALVLAVHETGALPVRHEFMIVMAHWWDTMCGADYLHVDAKQIEGGDATDGINAACDTAISDAALATAANLTTVDTVVDGIQTDLSNGTDGLGALKTLIDAVDTVADAVKAVTDNLPNSGALTDLATAAALTTVDTVVDGIQTDLSNATDGLGALKALIDTADTAVDAVKAVTDNLPDSGALTTISGYVDCLPVTLNNVSAADVNAQCDTAISDAALGTAANLATVDTVVDGIQTDLSNVTDGLGALKALIDTVDTVADAVKAVTDNLPNSGALSDIDTGVNAVEAKLPSKAYLSGSADIDGGIDATEAAVINVQADTALSDIDLDHVAKTTYGATKPADGSLFDLVMNKDAGQTFDATTDSLEAVRDNQAGADAGAIADALCDEALSGHTTAGTLAKAISDTLADTNELQGLVTDSKLAAQVKGIDDIDLSATMKASVNAQVDTALTDYDAPTKAELDSGLTGLNDLTAAEVNAQCDTAISDASLATAAALTTVDTVVDAIKVKTDSLPSGPAKGAALTNVPVQMALSTDHVSAATGKTVVCQVSKDSGAFAASTNSVSEVGSGHYVISLTDTEMNADTVVLKFTEDDCDTHFVNIITG